MGSILIVDDSPGDRLLVKEILKKGGYTDILMASSAAAAYEALGMGKPGAGEPDIDLILMDIVMPGVNGIEACYQIKSDENLRDIPIVMVTALGETDSLKMAFGGGAIDYIVKPVNRTELLARVRSILRLKYEMDRRKAREKELLEITRQLKAANKVLQSFSSLDGLTSIPNKRFFDEFFAREWVRAIRYERPISLLLIDLDFFALYNEIYGRHSGDFLLKEVAKTLSSMEEKPADLLARYGDEEFAFMLPETGRREAIAIAERVREKVSKLSIRHEGSNVSDVVTVSIGGASAIPERGLSKEGFIKLVEESLRIAKRQGHDQVVVTAPEAEKITGAVES